jgi:hypothetical protein
MASTAHLYNTEEMRKKYVCMVKWTRLRRSGTGFHPRIHMELLWKATGNLTYDN